MLVDWHNYVLLEVAFSPCGNLLASAKGVHCGAYRLVAKLTASNGIPTMLPQSIFTNRVLVGLFHFLEVNLSSTPDRTILYIECTSKPSN